ncbi:restriction endonuclease subunit S [Nostoc sp. DedQUE09]|uniref:restriction endonuclease subunit S n=1 Tax=Nostoc sp. DedQUE09 TaxID=3075394 RepID=UPI002AD2F269|nr:restriction endonuclease subunit S [Nostoc sp. DedQUE09]MDZ7952429.1 restriction endonuclease subunit S [Nostoc sp. DedQUE09]
MKNWELVRLGDVCNLINGRAYKKAELLHEGKYPVLRVGNFFSNRSWYYSDLELDDSKYCDDGDLLYAWSASFGPRIWKGGKVIYHYHIWKTNLNLDKVDKKYLYYWFEWDTERIKAEQGVGTTMIHVTKEAMENRSLYLPAISEQKRIVAILDEAFEGIDRAIANTEKNLANSRELFESYLNAIFTQKGNRRGDIKSQFVPLSTLLSEQPRNGWSPPAIFQTGEGIPVLTLSAVTGFNYDGSRVKLTSAPTKEKAHYWLKKGELLITRSNTPELVGHVAIYDGNPQQAICCDLIMKMTLDSTKADTKFIYYYLRSLAARKYLMSNATGASATMPKINKQVVQNAPIPVFCVAEQKIIVTKLDEIASQAQRLETIYRQKLAALNELKQSILQKAFTGELNADTANQTTKAAQEGIAA